MPLTFFTIPKPFAGHIGVIQRNAIASWCALGPEVSVVLMGDESGTAEAAADFGLRHVPLVPRNRFGTPLLNGLFTAVERVAPDAAWFNYINADIVLLDDFLPGFAAARREKRRFLMVGQRIDLDLREPLAPGTTGWDAELRQRARSRGRNAGPTAIDYFVFNRGLLGPLPPFNVGRFTWDNWLIYHARMLGLTVVDATPRITCVHQNHDYAHAGGARKARLGVEARENIVLAGGSRNVFTIWDATHVLDADPTVGLRRRDVRDGGFGGGIWSYRRSVRLGAA